MTDAFKSGEIVVLAFCNSGGELCRPPLSVKVISNHVPALGACFAGSYTLQMVN
jgi:hypothetical protein